MATSILKGKDGYSTLLLDSIQSVLLVCNLSTSLNKLCGVYYLVREERQEGWKEQRGKYNV